MGSMPEFPISLRTWPSKDGNATDALPSLIQRINAERGGFRGLTEESLLQEIAEAEAGKEEDSSDEEQDEDDEKPDRLQIAREEMLRQLEYSTLSRRNV